MSSLSRGARVGSYEVLEGLGAGAAGEVVRARGPDGRIVALKLLRRLNESSLGRFDRERRLLGSLGEAEGFVPLLDAGMSAHGPFIVMGLVEGGTLADRLARGPLEVEEARTLGLSLARALSQAHARGIVHRDLKPSNILLRRDGRPLVADLGIAKHFARDGAPAPETRELTTTGAIHGTLGYMAPEQMIDAKSVGPPADVFALGVILYECLARERPFTATSLVELVGKLDAGVFVPLRSLRREVPAAFAEAIERCLIGDPARRFQDGVALARALEQRSSRRWAPILGVSLGLAVLALVAIGVSAWPPSSRDSRSQPETPGPPSRPETRANPEAAQALALARAARARSRKEPAEALDDARRAVALDPLCAPAWLASAQARFDRAQKTPPGVGANAEWLRTEGDAARKEVDEAIRLDGTSARAFALRGVLAMIANDGAGGLVDAERALRIDPHEPLALTIRASTLINDEPDRALASALAATEADPSSAMAWAILGTIHHRQGLDSVAIDELSRAIVEQPANPTVLALRAELYLFQRRWDEAFADADRAIGYDEGVPMAWYVRGVVKAERDRDLAGAIADCKRAVGGDAPDPVSLATLGRYLGESGKLDDGVATLTRAIQLRPSYANAYDDRAQLHEKKGDIASAIADSKDCVRIAPSSAAAARCRKRLARLEGK